MIIIKLHPTNPRILTRQSSKRTHAAPVDVKRANREEIKKEAVVWF
jgi:hypothetical protein